MTANEMRISDWMSDVCSSDLKRIEQAQRLIVRYLLLRLRGGKQGKLETRGRRQVGHRGFPFRSQGQSAAATARNRPVGGWRAPCPAEAPQASPHRGRSDEHTSELQSLMRISYAVFCLKKKNHVHKTIEPCHTELTDTCLHQ